MSRDYASLVEIAGDVSRETFEALVTFEDEFKRWSRSFNLAAPSTLGSLWSRHILDSAQLVSLKPEAVNWLDLGSGGGFPGAVIAIMMRERDRAHVDLVESNGKKVSFLRTILAKLGAPARVHLTRIEQFRADTPPQIVTARALAPLDRLLTLSAPFLSRGATGLFHKGRDYLREVQESRDEWDFDLVEHVSRIDSNSRILEISSLRAKAER